MKWATRAKQGLRAALGDGLAARLHALRFVWLLRSPPPGEVELQLIPLLLEAGDVAVDVGANGANWTLPLARRVGPTGRVFAFEADPYYARVTRHTLALMGAPNVDFFPIGLSDRDERAPLQVIGEDRTRLSGTGRVVRGDGAAAAPPPGAVEVELRRLDGLLESWPRLADVRLFKCDVEGFELMVFGGARRVLEAARPVVVAEMGGAAAHGHDDDELFDFFATLDYASYVVGADPFELIASHTPGATEHGPRPNRVFLPRERRVDPRIRLLDG